MNIALKISADAGLVCAAESPVACLLLTGGFDAPLGIVKMDGTLNFGLAGVR
jgi:hypothetical protein